MVEPAGTAAAACELPCRLTSSTQHQPSTQHQQDASPPRLATASISPSSSPAGKAAGQYDTLLPGYFSRPHPSPYKKQQQARGVGAHQQGVLDTGTDDIVAATAVPSVGGECAGTHSDNCRDPVRTSRPVGRTLLQQHSLMAQHAASLHHNQNVLQQGAEQAQQRWQRDDVAPTAASTHGPKLSATSFSDRLWEEMNAELRHAPILADAGKGIVQDPVPLQQPAVLPVDKRSPKRRKAAHAAQTDQHTDDMHGASVLHEQSQEKQQAQPTVHPGQTAADTDPDAAHVNVDATPSHQPPLPAASAKSRGKSAVPHGNQKNRHIQQQPQQPLELRLHRHDLSTQEFDALLALPLPDCLERLLRIFQAINSIYGFLLQHDMMPTWRTCKGHVYQILREVSLAGHLLKCTHPIF